jgi:general secretion pathway protein E
MSIMNQILVPTDFSHNSSSALNYACDLARQSAGAMHIIHVLPESDSENERDAVGHLERLGSMLDARAKLPTITHRKVLSGKPARTITQFAKDHDIDLIVMGTHGRTGLAHLTMGSVAEKVMRDATCPVLVFGPGDGVDVSLNRAAICLASELGNGLKISKEEGFTKMLQWLTEQLRISSTAAMLMLDELEERHWIQWKDGRWIFTKGIDVLAEPTSEAPSFLSNQPALDLVQRARRMRATDIHIDPIGSDENLVRFRIDGQLSEYCKMTRDVTEHLVNQFKNLANLDISDPFHIKEGRIRMPTNHSDLDIRITIVPVAGGEAIAVRLLDPAKSLLKLDHLGLSTFGLEKVRSMITAGDGLTLVTGPTGSGKTTTVYSILQSIGGTHRNVVSIEDPVELALPFARQMNVDPRHGINMNEGLKAILRMDPDVVFIGEIRDSETAAIGMHAVSSGKQVFATLHTRDVASTITNLRQRNIADRNLAVNVSGIVNQRLVRRLCGDCKSARDLTADEMSHFHDHALEPPQKIFSPTGCPACRNTGYHGRVGVFEVAAIEGDLKEAIFNGTSQDEIEQILRSTGTVSLVADALSKVGEGLTSFSEAISIRWLA